MTRGERFKQAREAKGFSQKQASVLSCVACSTIKLLESEEYSDPKYCTIATLADLYGVDIRWLAEGVVQETCNDVVKVVRCKDCRWIMERTLCVNGKSITTPWCDNADTATDEDGFCHLGERKTNNDTR